MISFAREWMAVSTRRRVERQLRKSDTLPQVRYVRLASEVTHAQAISDKSVARTGLTDLLHFSRVVNLIWR